MCDVALAAPKQTFTVGVTLTLALGIGANAAMFSLVDRLLFRPPAGVFGGRRQAGHVSVSRSVATYYM